MKKKIFFIINLFSFVFLFGTTWKYEGGLDGEAGLMIVYKRLPPLIVEVEEPEIMNIPSGNNSFIYSQVSRARKPLNVKIEIYFNNSVTQENGINKEVIRTLYDTAKLSFKNEGNFILNIENSGISPKNVVGDNNFSIDGEVFFTNLNGLPNIDGNGKELTLKIGDSILGGTLYRSDIYLDAEFNKQKKFLLSGQYSGGAVLMVEFLGKEVGNK